jgi:inner membrane transporter RhtA
LVTFGTSLLMLALLPVFAVIIGIGAIVPRQLPTVQDVAGITLVVLGVALHGESAVSGKQREDMRWTT